MKYLNVDALNIPISAIGFGTWAIGGRSYGPVNDSDSLSALECAFDQGINLYDSANIYGDGHSEILLGKIFKGKRDKIILTTKAGYKNYSKRTQDFSEKFLRKSLDDSLKRLGSDYVDILFLHSPSREAVSSSQGYETLCKLKEEGKIRLKGISVRTANDGMIAFKKNAYDVLQVNLSLVEQQAQYNGLLNAVKKNKILILAKAPLHYGFLTGKYSKGSKFGTNDHRNILSNDQKDKLHATTESYRFLHIKNKRELSHAAIKFSMRPESKVIPIPGMKTIQQVNENIAALNTPDLSEEELSKIHKRYFKTDSF